MSALVALRCGEVDLTQDVLDAARIVADLRGPSRLSIAEIAKVSLIPQARIHQRFPNLSAVLGALSREQLADLRTRLRAICRSGVRPEWAELFVRLVVARVEESPQAAHFLFGGPFADEDRLEWRELILDLARAAGHGEPGASVSDLELRAAGALAAMRYEVDRSGRVTEEAARFAVRMLQPRMP